MNGDLTGDYGPGPVRAYKVRRVWRIAKKDLIGWRDNYCAASNLIYAARVLLEVGTRTVSGCPWKL